jgi:colanic acid/amylovoran biosynthesis glycosyltransferase
VLTLDSPGSVSGPRLDYVLDFLPTYVRTEIRELCRRGNNVRVSILGGDATREGASGPPLPEGSEQGFSVGQSWLDLNPAALGPAAMARLAPVITAHPQRFLRLAAQAASAGCFRYFLCGAELALKMRDAPPTRIHSHFATGAAHMAMWCSRLLGVQFSVTLYAADIFSESADEDRIRMLLEGASPPMTISSFNREYVAGRWGRETADRLAVVHPGIDTSDRVRTSEQPGPPLILCTAGSLAERKGLNVLIEACEQLRARGVAWNCQVTGSDRGGKILERFRGLARKAGLHQQLQFTGSLKPSRHVELLSQASVFVLPCIKAENGDMDGIPVSLVEAMGAGLPVVSSRLSGIPELVEHGISGLLVEPADAGGLAQAIEYMLKNQAEAAAMGLAARQRVKDFFSAESHVDALEEAWAGFQNCPPELDYDDA